MDPIETEFDFDDDTKNTYRFEEDPEQAPIVGRLYLQKWAVGDDAPSRVRVSIEAVDE